MLTINKTIFIFRPALILLVLCAGVIVMYPNDGLASHSNKWHREHTLSGEGTWKQTDDSSMNRNELEGDEWANIGWTGPWAGSLEGSYDNITFTDLEPGKYRIQTHGKYGSQSDEHMVFETSDGNTVTLYDLNGNNNGQTWLWGEKEINMNQPGGWIKIRAYSQIYPAAGSLIVDEVRIKLMEALQLPDLTASEPILNSGALEEGINLTFAGNVTNQGTADASGAFDNEFQVDVGSTGSYADPEDFALNALSSITNLLAGESKQALSSEWNNVPLGDYAVRLCADAPETTAPPICTETSDLIAYWKFDEGSGLTAADSSGNGNNGALIGPAWVSGKIGKALDFDGANDKVNAGDIDITGDFSISVWIYPHSSPNTDGQFGVVSKDNANDVINYAILYGLWSSNESDKKIRFRFRNQSSEYNVKSNAEVPLNTWTHILGTYNGSNLKIYINGSLDSSASAAASLPTHNSKLAIGGRFTGGNSSLFDGIIDDVRIYGRALSPGEIQQLYDSCSGSGESAAGTIDELYETNNCSPPYVFSIPPKPECSDGIDNDDDELIDGLDPGCWTDPGDPDTYDEEKDEELLIITPLLSAVPDTISQGDSSTLSWTCYDSTTSSGSGFSTGGATTGSTSVSPPNTTAYTLQCFNGADGRGQAAEQITVLNIPAVNISATPTTVRQGNASTITWSSTDVDSCSVTGPNGFSYTALSGLESTGAITQESIYTIVCQNAVTQASAQAKVTLLPKFEER
jgi:hypothetical protein